MNLDTMTIVEIGVAALTLILGYFRMYIPIADRMTMLEGQHVEDQKRADERTAQMEEINHKLDTIIQQQTQIFTTLFGVNGDNGFNSRIKKLEGDLEGLKYH